MSVPLFPVVAVAILTLLAVTAAGSDGKKGEAVDAVRPGCSFHDTCYGCVNADGWCGFCSSGANQGCQQGVSSGPDTGSCPKGDWHYDRSSCSPGGNVCIGQTTCDKCVNAGDGSGNCGWCSSSGSCSQGTASGPSQGSCPNGDWDWLTDECSYEPSTPSPRSSSGCEPHSTCSGCTGAPSGHCGWCSGDGRCKEGTNTGPTHGSCSSWSWYAKQCDGN